MTEATHDAANNPLVRDLRLEVLSDAHHLLRRATFELQQHDGRWDTVTREVYDRGDSAAALVWDPAHATVLLVRQFRLPAYLNGHPDGMLLEVPAGTVDDGEAPDETIRRELIEEIGHRVADVHHHATLYSSPGSLTERMWLYRTEYGADTRVGTGGGNTDESERLDVVELGVDDALAMVADGRIVDLKTVLLLQWLRSEVRRTDDRA